MTEIEKVIKGGHLIAEKIRSANNMHDFDTLVEDEISKYSNFVDENFGVIEPDDLFGEKSCELTTFLFVAVDWKRKTLQEGNSDNVEVEKEFKGYLEDFENFLDSKKWVKGSFGVAR